MNWDAVGAVAELVGAVGVVASLAYLAVQIRQNTHHIDFNTRAIRATTFQNFSNTFSDFEDLLLENDRLGTVWIKGLGQAADLEAVDRIVFNNIAHKFFRMYEVLFLQYEAGLVDASLFENAHRFPDQLLTRPGLRAYWSHSHRRYADTFVDFIAQRLKALPTAGAAGDGSA